MTTLVADVRRFLTLLVAALWLGGLTFYGAVVIPIGTDVLGSHTEVGFITRQSL